jgi:hypothetical protein
MRFLSLLILIVLVSSCNKGIKPPDISDIQLETKIQRFERELFEMDVDTIPDAINYFYREYGDFYDIFNYYIVDLGRPSDKAYSGYLTLFIKDDLNREVYEEVNEIFPDLEPLEKTLNKAFRYFSYYFPEKEVPHLVSYVSRFNYPFFTVSDYIGIGLDMYLGTESEFYPRLGLPAYQTQNMFPEKIPSDILANWGTALFPFNDSSENVLSHLVHEGKLIYFLRNLLPDQPDSLIMGFTESQMKWCKANEEQMWTYLVEEKLVFSSDPMNYRKLVNPAPFTSFFSSESPGRAAVWIGYNIVQEYARRNPDKSLAAIMEETNYQEILKLSKYNP